MRLPRLSFTGITFYPGHIKDNDEAGREQLVCLGELIRSMLDDFRRAGINRRNTERDQEQLPTNT